MVAGAFLLVTCEHGGNRVPKRYRRLFAGWESVLASHRGYDPGALTLARELARAFDAPLVASTVTRLLVAWKGGSKEALDLLTPLVYDELRRLADHYLRNERAAATLQPTALVHEAWLRLGGEAQPNCEATSTPELSSPAAN